jgi:hypothetical protein
VEGYNKILYSEELNKKTKIQTVIQNNKFKTENDQKIDYSIINKYNPDIALNLNKYIEENNHLTKNRKAIYNQMKNYLNSLNKIEIKSSKKKKVFKIKKKPQKKLEIYSDSICMDYKKNVSNIIIKYLYEKKHFFILARIRKSLLIKSYGFILGNLINDKIFGNNFRIN